MFRCFPRNTTAIPLPKVLDPDHRLLRLCQLNQLSLSSTVSWPGCFRGAIENNHKTNCEAWVLIPGSFNPNVSRGELPVGRVCSSRFTRICVPPRWLEGADRKSTRLNSS